MINSLNDVTGFGHHPGRQGYGNQGHWYPPRRLQPGESFWVSVIIHKCLHHLSIHEEFKGVLCSQSNTKTRLYCKHVVEVCRVVKTTPTTATAALLHSALLPWEHCTHAHTHWAVTVWFTIGTSSQQCYTFTPVLQQSLLRPALLQSKHPTHALNCMRAITDLHVGSRK